MPIHSIFYEKTYFGGQNFLGIGLLMWTINKISLWTFFSELRIERLKYTKKCGLFI
ncbi:hypothetical protein SAMN05720759_101335 [Fibrobacter sp. UWB12]|nr:hypothetical protein SAMN05720759_101335 [Fibrobacter sp. UWB12]